MSMASLDAKSIQRIDRQRFADMLNILPPVSWVGIGSQAESFMLSECVDSAISRIFCRIGLDHFELTGDMCSSHDSIVERCRAFRQLDAPASSAAMTDKARI
jgi:hypothetical protein